MKTELGAVNCLYPLPTTLVGAHVKGKPNFITIAHVGIMDLGSLSLGMIKAIGNWGTLAGRPGMKAKPFLSECETENGVWRSRRKKQVTGFRHE